MDINCWWMRDPHPGNMGDIITPVIVNRIFRAKCRWVDYKKPQPHFIMTGSIIKFANKHSTVWGSGTIQEVEKLSPDAEYLSVRGPITYELVKQNGGKVNDIFGDPAMLLPLFHKNTRARRYKVGILPHYVDYKAVKSQYTATTPDIRIIDILNSNPLQVIDQILECERIVTSSLHGAIVSNAYGVPVALVKYSDLLVGDGSKFRDHLLSVGIDKFHMTELTHKLSLEQLESLPYIKDTQFDGTRMVQVLENKLRGNHV